MFVVRPRLHRARRAGTARWRPAACLGEHGDARPRARPPARPSARAWRSGSASTSAAPSPRRWPSMPTGGSSRGPSCPTSHEHADGVAAGVVAVVADVAGPSAPTAIELVTHSTTQAVNALLEGDVATGRHRRDGRRARPAQGPQAHALEKVELTDGRPLRTTNEFLDVTGGLDPADVGAALDRLVAAGAGADRRRRGLRPRRHRQRADASPRWPPSAGCRPPPRPS